MPEQTLFHVASASRSVPAARFLRRPQPGTSARCEGPREVNGAVFDAVAPLALAMLARSTAGSMPSLRARLSTLPDSL